MHNCILCDQPLDAEKVNLEHYVPATAIRNFAKLGIPAHFDWALRINTYYGLARGGLIEDGSRFDASQTSQDRLQAPISKHRAWATVRVHQRCNQDASPMCQDLKHLIDNLDNSNPGRIDRIKEYYAHIWRTKANNIKLTIRTPTELEAHWPTHLNKVIIYTRGLLDLGRLEVAQIIPFSNPGVELHRIYIGTKKHIGNNEV